MPSLERMRSIWRRSAGNGVAVAVGLQPDLLAIDADDAAGRIFQAVDAAQQRRLAGAEPPMMATTSPSRADSETPFSTCSSPNFLCRFSIWMASAAPSCAHAVVRADRLPTPFMLRRSTHAAKPGCWNLEPITLSQTLVPLSTGWTGRLASVNPPLWPLPGMLQHVYWLVWRTAWEETKLDVQLQRSFGSQSMAGPLEARADALGRQRHAPCQGIRMALRAGLRSRQGRRRSTRRFADLVAASGAEIEWLTEADDGLADSVFTHDPSLMTDHGAIILSMGKALRAARSRRCTKPPIGAWASRSLAASKSRARSRAATASGSTPNTLAVGRGVRTNQAGIQQLANLLEPKGVEVYGFDLPLWHGEEACLHLMSVISPLADDLALVYAPLLAGRLLPMLRARGIRLVEGDAGEFFASNGLSLNVLPTAPARGDRGRRLSRRQQPRWRRPAAWSRPSRPMRCASPARAARPA